MSLADATRSTISDWLMAYPPSTRDGYRRDVEQLADFLPVELLEADRNGVQRWVQDLLERRHLASTSVRRKTAAAASFFEFCRQQGLVEHNPCEYVRRPRGGSVPKSGLPAVDAIRLLDAARAHSKAAHALMWLMAGEGLRAAEACRVRLEDVTGAELQVLIKGGSYQVKPLSKAALRAIRAAAGGRTSGPIVTNSEGNPMSRRRAWELVTTLATSVGIANCTPHTLRHTAATLALAAGARIEDVKELLGHKNLETTLRYVQNRDAQAGARDAAERLAQMIDQNPDEGAPDGE